MTDKVQKIRKEIESYKSAAEHFLKYKDNLEQWRIQKDLCDKFLYFIDSLQEEPKFKTGDRIKPIDSCLGSPRTIVDVCDSWYVTDQGTLDFEFEDNWELVEQNPADKIEPKFKVKYAGSEYNVFEIKDIAGVTYYGIEDEPNHIDYVLPDNCEIVFEQKPAWSEEDEQYVKDTLALLAFGASVHTISQVQDWLKSLKDKVQPQPKQEWDEEDERIYKVILELMDSYSKGTIGGCIISPNTDRYIKWFKSLKDRYTWKPSEEQMERLKGTINSLPHQEALYSLYQDLKKLKG